MDSILLDGFDGDEVDGFRKTIELGEMKMFGSKSYYSPDAKLLEVGDIKEEAAGIFSAKVKFESAGEKVRVTFRSRIRKLVEVALASVRDIFGGSNPTSIEAAVKTARKSAIAAGYNPKDLAAEFIDEAGMTELVVVPTDSNRPLKRELANNDSRSLALSNRSADHN